MNLHNILKSMLENYSKAFKDVPPEGSLSNLLH